MATVANKTQLSEVGAAELAALSTILADAQRAYDDLLLRLAERESFAALARAVGITDEGLRKRLARISAERDTETPR